MSRYQFFWYRPIHTNQIFKMPIPILTDTLNLVADPIPILSALFFADTDTYFYSPIRLYFYNKLTILKYNFWVVSIGHFLPIPIL